jgi:signal transduction histidine kinase
VSANPPAGNRFSNVFRSIRFRLSLWFVIVLALIMAGFSGFVYYSQAQSTYNRAEDRLNLRMRELDLLIRRSPLHEEGDLDRVPVAAITSDKPLQSNEVLVASGVSGGSLTSWGPITSPVISQLVSLAPRWESGRVYPVDLETNTGKVERYIFSASPIFYEGHQLGWITLGQPVDPEGLLRRLLVTLVIAGLSTLVLALLGGFWLASRALKPVQGITRTAREIGGSDLSSRLAVTTRDEIGELAETFNQMLERLEAAFNRQKQFTADASHELRTPLTIIGLEASRALSGKRSSEDYQRTLETIQSENEFMTRLVGQLLTLARMDSGNAQLRLESLDLSSLVLEVIERMAPIAAQKNVHLQAGELPELPLEGDRQYLLQMIGNLVENAIKYTSGIEGGRVLVETEAVTLNGKAGAHLCVSDNGPGIDHEHLPHIFDRFFRADQARSHNVEDDTPGREIDGVGLGLSIVNWIVQMHRGEITAASEPGEGTRVLVTLPAAS